jgi:hypothetical protein
MKVENIKIKLSFLVFLIGLTLPISASFAITIEWHQKPVSIQKGWGEFILSMKDKMANPKDFLSRDAETYGPYDSAYLKLSLVEEIPNTLILAFNYTTVMNFALLRASTYTENLNGMVKEHENPLRNDGKLVLRNKQLIKAVMQIGAGGHDLRGIDFINYWNLVDSLDHRTLLIKRTLPYFQDLQIENKVREILEPILVKNPDMTIVAFALSQYNVGIVSHELSHAQFFNLPEYRQAVRTYWMQMSEEDKSIVRKALSQSVVGYDASDEELMMNEFQAYMNSVNAHIWGSMMPEIYDPHYSLFKAHILRELPESRLIHIENVERAHRLPLCSKYLLAR